MTAPAPEGLSAWLRAVVHAGRDGSPLPEVVAEHFVRLRRRIQREFAEPPESASTWIGSPEEPAGAEGHWAALYGVLADGRADECTDECTDESETARAAEAGFHAAFLLGALTDEERGFTPRVSAVLAGSGTSEEFLPIVESLLDQTHAELEIVVLDRSATFFEDRLGPAASRVTIVDDDVEDPAAALDRALRAARGEVVQFVDLAHRFVPGAIARKVAVFAAIPEARVVFDGGSRLAAVRERLVAGTFERRELPVSSFAVPRHLILRTGAFDEGLGSEGIDRYWSRVRARPEAWIGLRENLRATLVDGECPESGPAAWSATARERSVLDRLTHPPSWRSLSESLSELDPAEPTAFVLEACRRLEAHGRESGLSPRPILAAIRDRMVAQDAADPASAAAADALATLERCFDAAPVIGAADLELWIDGPTEADERPEGVAIDFVFERLRESIREGAPIVDPERLLRIARARPDRLDRYFCRQIVKWSRRMSVAAACELACTIMPYAVETSAAPDEEGASTEAPRANESARIEANAGGDA